MSTIATVAQKRPQSWASLARIPSPNALFWIAVVIIFGGCAGFMASNRWLDFSTRDLWQHTAALRALIADPADPSNPFVNSVEPSRHFHPYWWAMAMVARTFGLSPIQAIDVAAFISAGTLAVGFFLFGRAYFRSEWGPFATLLCCTLGWSLPISHTGFVNIPTLVEGIAYPAPLLVGLSLVLWAIVIRAFESFWRAVWIVPLAALMFSVHQFGAVLGFIVAVPLALLWPGHTRTRVAILTSMAAGVLLSTAWVYFNPIEAVIRAGNPTWRHGIDFYTPLMLVGLFIPSSFGVVGLLRSNYGGPGKPLLLAYLFSLAAFVAGAFGILIATRFAPLFTLLSQIGLAALVVPFLENPSKYTDGFKLKFTASVFGVVLFQSITIGVYFFPVQASWERKFGNVMEEAKALTSDVPDDQQVAAFDAAAWPLAAAGQKVLSVPWPEPFISDLASRQQKVEHLFDLGLSKEQRIQLARAYGVRILILDDRLGPVDQPREWKMRQLRVLMSQSIRTQRAGPMWRFDLY